MFNQEIIVLGATQTGLSTLRCLKDLKRNGSKIILVYKKTNYKLALFSNIPHEKIEIKEDNWGEGLLVLRKHFRSKPVLLFTQDDQIVSISNITNKLKKYYSFLLPDNEIVALLMEKVKFTQYAIRNNLPIPYTKIIQTKKQLIDIHKHIDYPIIIKPFLKHALIARNFLLTLNNERYHLNVGLLLK